MIRNEHEGGQAEVVWTWHEERPEVCRRTGDKNGVEKRKSKGQRVDFVDVV